MIIAFTGKMKSGKSTACDLLQTRGYEILNFADPLKRMAADLLDLPLSECYSQEAKEAPRQLALAAEDLMVLLDSKGLSYPRNLRGPSVFQFNNLREVLQWIGTELFRESSESFWVDTLLSSMSPNKNYVVGDCRFPNEVKAIQDAGGTVILIQRPSVASSNNHASEQIVDKDSVDYAILNTDLSQFRRDVLMIEELINGKRQARTI